MGGRTGAWGLTDSEFKYWVLPLSAVCDPGGCATSLVYKMAILVYILVYIPWCTKWQ